MPFHRDRQVILIEHSLSPSENIEFEIEYEGNIDEDIYQVNIPDEEKDCKDASWKNTA